MRDVIQNIESVITTIGRTKLPERVSEAVSQQAGDWVRYLILNGEVLTLAVRPISRLFGANTG